jgi:hypothetical protein
MAWSREYRLRELKRVLQKMRDEGMDPEGDPPLEGGRAKRHTAQSWLGDMYSQGQGVPQDYAQHSSGMERLPVMNAAARATRESHARPRGSGPPLTTYTPIEMSAIAIQSIAEGHSPRIGMAMKAVIAGQEAAKAAPLDAPRIPTARP